MGRAAVRYAKAILELAKDQKAEDAVFEEMEGIQKTIFESKELKNLLESPLIKTDVKINSLKAVFSKSSNITLGLFNSLSSNKRLSILDDVALSFIALYKQDKGAQQATVKTAIPLTKELETQVLNKVKELTGKSEVSLENIVDPSIIGGFILRVGDLQYNASIANQLANLKRSFNDGSFVSQLN